MADTGNGFGGLCASGHDVPVGAAYCPTCGAPAFPPTQTFGSQGGTEGSQPGAPPAGWAGPQAGPPPGPHPQYGPGAGWNGPQAGPPPGWAGPAPGWNAPSPGQVPGYYPPPAWNPPPYGGAPPPYYAAAPSTNGLAIASMVLGILWFWWVGSILAVIFGHVALNQIGRRGDRGRGMAIAGLVLGYVGLASLVAVIIASIVIRA